MADDKKKQPKIDLKSRIPSKTVKGMTGTSSGAIPPPPNVVQGPPPDILAQQKPKVVVDKDDPLAVAKMVDGAGQQVESARQIVVVQNEPDTPTSKKGVLYALIVLGLIVGLGGGYVAGSNKARSDVASAAKTDAKEIQERVSKTNETLSQFSGLLKQAQNELDAKGEFDPKTIEAVKNFKIDFGPNDLRTRELKYFGEDTAGRVLAYAAKVANIDSMRADLTRGSRLESANAAIKNFTLPSNKFKYAIQVQKPGDDKAPPITTASMFDMGDSFELKDRVDTKTQKIKTVKPEKEYDAWPAGAAKPPDFFGDKAYISPLSNKDFTANCPIRGAIVQSKTQQIADVVAAIDGTGGDDGIKGTIDAGKDLIEKLKSLAK